jgi:hypothetical protein
MFVEQRTYTLHPGQYLKYLDIYEKEGLEIQRPILGNLVGYFFTDIGPLNQIVHMWGYESLDDRAIRRKKLFEDSGWRAYIQMVVPMIASQESKMMIPAPFSPIGGIR